MMKKAIKKPMKGTMPAAYADGGKASFKGKEDKAEEMSEAKAVRGGKMTPKQYVAAEKGEGEKESAKSLMAKGKALASGKMSAGKYAAMEKMANGGMVKTSMAKMANGGMVKGSMKKGC